jgi:hypothetical protein
MAVFNTPYRWGQQLLVLTVLLFVGLPVMAQMPSIAHWLTLQVPVMLDKQWQWHNDGGYRTLGNDITGHQFFYRSGLRKQLGKGWSVAAGAALFFTRSSFDKGNHIFGEEPRLWQEIEYRCRPTKQLTLQARFRPEQRFFAAVGNQGAFYATRLRYRLGITQQLAHRWHLQLANEYMHQTKNSRLVFNQNRTMVGATYQLTKSRQLYMGYMWLQWPLYKHQHITQITFIQTISLHANSE